MQLRLLASTAPFMCRPPATLMVPFAFTVPGWQLAQAVRPPVTAGCPCAAGGGRPWQVPQAACVPSTLVQVGVVSEPPPLAMVPPWQ